MLAVAALGFGACGGSDRPREVPVTDTGLVTSLQFAAQEKLDDQGLYDTRAGSISDSCVGNGARWNCRVQVQLSGRVPDSRTYAVTVNRKGCWVARQTGTDVRSTGRPVRPTHPSILRGCVR